MRLGPDRQHLPRVPRVRDGGVGGRCRARTEPMRPVQTSKRKNGLVFWAVIALLLATVFTALITWWIPVTIWISGESITLSNGCVLVFFDFNPPPSVRGRFLIDFDQPSAKRLY